MMKSTKRQNLMTYVIICDHGDKEYSSEARSFIHRDHDNISLKTHFISYGSDT